MTKKKGSEVLKNGGLKILQRIDYFYMGIITVFAFVLYARCLKGNFLFNDRPTVILNQDSYANSTGSVWDLLQHNSWGADLSTSTPNRLFCPLAILTFRIQNWFNGFHHSALALRAVNFILSALNGAWVYVFAHHVLPAAVSHLDLMNSLGPALAMLLFMVHPTHTEAVLSAEGRADLLSTFFGFSALYCVQRTLVELSPIAGKGKMSQTRSTGIRGYSTKRLRLNVDWRRVAWFICASLFSTLSVLSNDIGIVFVGFCFIYALMLLQARDCTSFRAVSITGAAFVLCLAAYWHFRTRFTDETFFYFSPMFRRTEKPHYFIASGIWPWITMRLLIHVKNMELLFFPTQLCCEYSYNCPPSIESLADARLPLFLTVVVLSLAVLVLCAVRILRHRSPLTLSFTAALLWIALPYALTSFLRVRTGAFISERSLYAPSIGVVMFFALLFTFPRGKQWRAAALITSAFLVLFWSYLTFLRVGDWHNDETLFRSTIRVCPESGKAHYQLAAALVDKQADNHFNTEVLRLFRKAYELDSEVKEALYFLAIHEQKNGNAEKALSFLRECTSSPYTLTMCYPLFSKLRTALYPNMKRWQMFEDNAAIGYSLEEKATHFRLAGIALAEDEKDFCRSAHFLRRALDMWNESGLFWINTRIVKDHTVSFCTTLSHYTEKICDCLASPDAPQNISASVIETTKFIRDAMMRCDTEPWANVRLSRQHLYVHRPAQFDYTFRIVQQSVARRLLNIAISDTAVRAVRRTIAEAVVRRYCYISTFVQSDVGRQLAAKNREIAAVSSAFFRHRAMLLQTAIEASLGMQSQGESEEFFALLQCAQELTAFLKRENKID